MNKGHDNDSQLLEEIVGSSSVCTEPAAIGLAVSIAFWATKGVLPNWLESKYLEVVEATPADLASVSAQNIACEIEKIRVSTDRDIFKNSLNAGISYTSNLKGHIAASAAGVFCNPDMGLDLFNSLDTEKAWCATSLIKDGKIEFITNYDWDELHIEAEVVTKTHTGRTVILCEHANVVSIEVDGQTQYNKIDKESKTASRLRALRQVAYLVNIAENLTKEAAAKAEKSVQDNFGAFLEGKRLIFMSGEDSYGFHMMRIAEQRLSSGDFIYQAKVMVGLAVEARMMGFHTKVATCAGSGNMGLVATLPLLALALSESMGESAQFDSADSIKLMREECAQDWKRLIRAVALAHLVAKYASNSSSELSAMCGCGVKAGFGLAAGATYYLCDRKGSLSNTSKAKRIGFAINNMAGAVTGMICDGAKRGCALKVTFAVQAALECALLAASGYSLSNFDGILNKNPMGTLRNVGAVSKAMVETDKKIIELLCDRKFGLRR